LSTRVPILMFVALLAAASLSPAAAARLPELEYDRPVVASRWGLSMGGFVVDLDTSAAVGVHGILGGILNLEEILGLDATQSLARMDGFYRFKPRHAIDVTWLSIARSSTTELGNRIDFDEVSFEGFVESRIDMDLFKVTYKWSFLNNGKVNTGLIVGLSTYRLGADLRGEGRVLDIDGNPIDMTDFHETGIQVIAPVPTLGVFSDFAPKPWFVLRLSGELLDLSIGDIEGRFLDIRATMDFYFTRNVGIGIGLNQTSLEYQNRGDNPLRVNYEYGGILFYLSLAF
jgi:hypothetical protein